MSRDISPIKLMMFDTNSSREECRMQSDEEKMQIGGYNPTININRDEMKRFHTVRPLLAEKLKLDLGRAKRYSMVQGVKTENCIKIQPINSKLEEFNQVESKSKLEENKEQVNENSPTMKKVTPKYKLFLLKVIDSNYTLAVMTLFTLFALFSSDIELAFCPASVDFSFDVIQCFIMFIFALEIILASIAKEEYMWSFFFWLDIIATLSIIQDVSFMFDPMIGTTSTFTVYDPFINSTFITNNNTNSTNVKNQAQTTIKQFSSASRATRILKIVRIIRLIRILKLYKNAIMARENLIKKNKKKTSYKIDEISFDDTPSNNYFRDTDTNFKTKIENEGSDKNSKYHDIIPPPSEVRSISISKNSKFCKRPTVDSLPVSPRTKRKSVFQINKIQKIPVDDILKESKISIMLSEATTKKIITLIIGLLLIIPIISENFYADDNLKGYTSLSKYIDNYWLINPDYLSNYNMTNIQNDIVANFLNRSIDQNFPIISISINDSLFYVNSSWNNHVFRSLETVNAVSDDGYVQIIYSDLTNTILSAHLNICKTFFVCILIGCSAMIFERDARELVLQPLELMIEIVDTVSKDPVNANDIKKLKSGVKSTLDKFNKKGNKENHSHHNNYEMKVIEKAIIKISALLAIGFGEAGGEIIKENLSIGSEFNPLLKGKKKTAIYGFCDIRNFSVINEALQETTISFVNRIAEIVHTCVEKYGGSANKNIGEAFLNVWKFRNLDNQENIDPINEVKIRSANDNLYEVEPTNKIIRNTADMTILGFLSVMKKINKDPFILEYRKDQKILEKIKDFKVDMGFGLHMGWGIEGAIGSSYKIDASYLSPNVNISARLEAATKQYGVSILISGSLFNILSDEMKDICRLIDIVKLKGSNIPVKLYTIDVNLDLTKKRGKKIKILSEKVKKTIFIKKKNKFREMIISSDNIAAEFLGKKSFVELLRTDRNLKFYSNWQEGFEHYINGKWKEAEKNFVDCLLHFPTDGPCLNLLNYIRSQDCRPQKWNGYRVLTSK